MNIQHSSRTDSWMTPASIIAMVHEVLGVIDLDPASSYLANKTVEALQYFDAVADGLTSSWSVNTAPNIYCNPPGGKLKNQSLTYLFWRKLMQQRTVGLGHAIFMFFSVEGLAVSQKGECSPATAFPLCIPAKRIKFDWPGEGAKNAPSHSNAIVYVPGSLDQSEKFAKVFSSLGSILRPYDAQPKQESFWEAMNKSAELSRPLPDWSKAGINLNDRVFTTYRSKDD